MSIMTLLKMLLQVWASWENSIDMSHCVYSSVQAKIKQRAQLFAFSPQMQNFNPKKQMNLFGSLLTEIFHLQIK